MWRSFFLLAACSSTVLPGFATRLEAADEEGFESIFDGKTLAGWDGNPKFWRVEEEAITGQTTKENPTKGNTFIVWRKGQLADFELKLEYRIVGGNSGIQYRSFEKPNEWGKWVVGGYQADFEAGDRYSGILYGERYRGILADRGQRTVIQKGGKAKVVGSVGDSDEIQKKIKKEDWNTYHIVARGNHFIHKINGVVTCESTDEDDVARASGILALQLHAGPPMKVQFRKIRLKRLKASGKKVAFMAGRRSHGYGAHEHYAGCMILANALRESLPGYEVDVFRDGWPRDPEVLKGIDCLVMYADGGAGHPVNKHLQQVDELADAGVGIACIHYGVEVPKGESGDHFLKWIGGYFEPDWSVNPHWTASFAKLPRHPITQGVKPFKINDEWYYHMRFRDDMEGVTPILSDLPPASSLQRPDGPHSGNRFVRAAVLERKERQHMAWASVRPNGGRGFGFTGGHVHWNWGNPNFRKLVLNAIVWCAGGAVPAQGVTDGTLTIQDLEKNQDYPQPANFDPQKIVEEKQLSTHQPASEKKKASAKPLYASPIVTPQTTGHAVTIDVDLQDAKRLFLVVRDGGNGYGCDWADWIDPRISGPAGELSLIELPWKSAVTAWGQVRVNKNAAGGPLRVAGNSIGRGIGTHANSVIEFAVPEGFSRFRARGGLDNGGTDQRACGGQASVQFLVYTSLPTTTGGDRSPDDALGNLDVGQGLEATLFAAEPIMQNPTNIDIDHRGRVWVCEVVNYRHFANKDKAVREAGDRILILTDTDQDGVADKRSVFYQSRDIDSAHGICVLPTPAGPGTRVIVSAGAHVFVLTDDDGDDQADRRDTLFSGIGGVQHDHGIHAFVVGPDGKLYFNFGNEGKQIRDASGKPIKDLAGNRVSADRKPYQQGMVFRCNPDGSEFETLGWNFRNNWEVTVDSFGTLWQSDNDDDGNRGVRINYVMEFGNYGYRDEMTGAGWKTERTGMAEDVPTRHWHQNDPGVVPNLLQTGAGSPTGICVYEGSLLPEVFRNQMIHTDAGPSIVRAYPVQSAGAGYRAKSVSILHGARDNWFRPSDVCVAPDGSLYVADWYDPGVGGHRMGDVDRGRIFRVAPPGHAATVPKFDFSTVQGAISALRSPNRVVQYLARTSLRKLGTAAEQGLATMFKANSNPRFRARALWLLGKGARGDMWVQRALEDSDPNIRSVGIRLARQRMRNPLPVVAPLVEDDSPLVRRELAIALRHQKVPAAAGLWAQLALRHDGKDRWYLEALGLAADGQESVFFTTWLKHVGDQWNTPAGHDIIWRSRAPEACAYLARILTDEQTPIDAQPRFFRAFDFHSGPAKEAALKSILGD